jgi:hypothetical protein
MVIERLLDEPDFIRLPEAEKKILTLSAALHDIAKPVCSKSDNGEIISPNHAARGEIEARKLIYKNGFMDEIFGKLTFEEREQVCSLVRFHGLPTLFLDKPDMKRYVLRAACELNPRRLALLSTADVKGRICPDGQELLEKIALFNEMCGEWGCADGARRFPDSAGRFLYFKYGEQYFDYTPYDEGGSTVYLLCGIPASGKDTYIEKHLGGIPIISLDEIRKESPADR